MALSDSVVGYWKLDESSGNAADSSGNSNTLTNNNTVTYSAGKINNGASFASASSQSFSIADGSQTGLDLSGDCSFAGWVKFSAFTNATVFFAKTDGNSARSYIVRVLNSGDGYLMNAECYGDGTTSNRRGANSDSAFTTTTGTWFHFAATFDVDTGTWVLYKNGSVIASTASNAGTVASIYNSSNKFQMGATNNAGADEQFADAMFDEMGVWSRTLSPVEVSDLYNSGTGLQYPFTRTTDLKVKAGTYTGDGSDPKTISGVGFQPKVVIIMATTGTGDQSAALYKTDGMSTGATGITSRMGENGQNSSGEIDSLNSDGFLVRGQKNINTTVYYYLALGGTSCVTGTYTGDGTDNRAITGVGFQPKWVVTQGGNWHTRHKSTATGNSTDSAQGFSALADAANFIQSLDADGFTVGNDASGTNVSGTTYYYFAVNATNVTSGTYTGNGSDNRAITGVGFAPVSVFIKDTAVTNQAGARTGEAGDLTSKMRANTAPAANLIQSLDSDGFTLGTDGIVNTNTSTYYWVAFGAAAASGPTNLKSLDTNLKANIKSYNTNVIANVKSINTNA